MRNKKKQGNCNRIVIEVDGKMRRLSWIVEHNPRVLIEILCGSLKYKSNRESINPSAIFSEFAKVGLRKKELKELTRKHPEWNLDLNDYYPV